MDHISATCEVRLPVLTISDSITRQAVTFKVDNYEQEVHGGTLIKVPMNSST